MSSTSSVACLVVFLVVCLFVYFLFLTKVNPIKQTKENKQNDNSQKKQRDNLRKHTCGKISSESFLVPRKRTCGKISSESVLVPCKLNFDTFDKSESRPFSNVKRNKTLRSSPFSMHQSIDDSPKSTISDLSIKNLGSCPGKNMKRKRLFSNIKKRTCESYAKKIRV
jgi:hypothetical protein